MRILETRSHLSCRLQIGEQSERGWTVVLYPPGQGGPITFRSEDPAGLSDLIAAAQARASEIEARSKPQVP